MVLSAFPEWLADWQQAVTENAPDLAFVLIVLLTTAIACYVIVFLGRIVVTVASTSFLIFLLVVVMRLSNPQNSEKEAASTIETIFKNLTDYIASTSRTS